MQITQSIRLDFVGKKDKECFQSGPSFFVCISRACFCIGSRKTHPKTSTGARNSKMEAGNQHKAFPISRYVWSCKPVAAHLLKSNSRTQEHDIAEIDFKLQTRESNTAYKMEMCLE